MEENVGNLWKRGGRECRERREKGSLGKNAEGNEWNHVKRIECLEGEREKRM